MAHTLVLAKQKALVLPEKHGKLVLREVDVPKPGSGEVLVREDAIGLNPIDYFIPETGLFVTLYPIILGWEAAGIVVQLGEGVSSVAVGDKALYPGVVGDGDRFATFKQYSVVPADLVSKASSMLLRSLTCIHLSLYLQIPDNLSVEQAAAVPVGLDTAALGLYAQPGERDGAGLSPAPWEAGGRGKYQDQPILVLGGASSVGQYAIQLARLSGFSPIITTASLKNAEYLKSLGATHVIDRHLPRDSVVAAVRGLTEEPIRIVYDAASTEDTHQIGYEVLESGTLVNVTIGHFIPEDKLTSEKHISDIFGNPYLPDRRELSAGLYKQLIALLSSGELKASHVLL
ncbi:hypothetical protein NM688_g4312 [Phlebia brevispora]|uniref:Uncharacterized protein n=1 Tax=Phlebia brevispora TaxID=194682 RepID=A0ACC1T399_9APHY|nr:hypothetical protein NM688_g4312 [Phlebia brevispora]